MPAAQPSDASPARPCHGGRRLEGDWGRGELAGLSCDACGRRGPSWQTSACHGEGGACGANTTQSARRDAKLAENSLGASHRRPKEQEIFFFASFADLRDLCVELHGPLQRSNGGAAMGPGLTGKSR